jgi:NADPH2:quinone reductase
MKSVQIDRYGGPEVLVRRDVQIPRPGAGEVLVRLAYSGINFMDVHTRQGKYAGSQTYPVRLPTTLGMEGSGVVEAVGAGVADFVPGDRVAYCLVWSSYAEYAVVPAWRLVEVPDALTLDMAAASVFHGFTAHYLAHDVGRLAPGRTCLIHAASGGIGQILIQLAKRAGATVLATTSSEEKAAVARSRGADVTMLYDGGRFAEAVREATGGDGVDVVFDPIGKATLRDSFRACAKRGLIVAYGSVSGSVRDLDPIELGEGGGRYLTRPPRAPNQQHGPGIRPPGAPHAAGRGTCARRPSCFSAPLPR